MTRELIRAGGARGRGLELLARSGVSESPAALVGLAVSRGAGGSLQKWPWRRWAELVRRLRRKVGGVEGILIAHADDLWPAVRVSEETARAFPVVGPDLDEDDLAAVLARLDLVIAAVGRDLDLAAQIGAPTLALSKDGGAKPPAHHGPERREIKGPFGRLRWLSVERVLAAAVEMLRGANL